MISYCDISGSGGAPVVDMGAYELMRAMATLNTGESTTLIPNGGSGTATEDAQVVFENTSGPGGATVTVTQFDTDLHVQPSASIFSPYVNTPLFEQS